MGGGIQKLKEENGFTFLEAVMAMAVLTIGIVWLLQIFPSASVLGKLSQLKTQAVFLAQEKIEETIAESYKNVAVGTATESPLDSPFEKFSRKTEVIFLDADLQPAGSDYGLKKVEVTVSWPALFGAGQKQIKLTSLIAEK